MRTVSEAFGVFLERQTPLESQRQAAAGHRASVESSIRKAQEVYRFAETGSFSHGTGIRNYSDVDVLVSLKAGRPNTSDTALGWVRDALRVTFPNTLVRVSRPAVVVEFATKSETWEVIPGFITGRGGEGVAVYDIPGPDSGWIDTAPFEHVKYVNSCNVATPGAKKLARLIKAWKYLNSVPISSFYLEMRAAQYAKGHAPFVEIWDICGLLESLQSSQLAGMNDPSNASGRIEACSTDAKRLLARLQLATASTRARKALEAYRADKYSDCFYYLNLLFNDKFPSQNG